MQVTIKSGEVEVTLQDSSAGAEYLTTQALRAFQAAWALAQQQNAKPSVLPKKYASGGLVRGPGNPGDDRIPLHLEPHAVYANPGEQILTKADAERLTQEREL